VNGLAARQHRAGLAVLALREGKRKRKIALVYLAPIIEQMTKRWTT
jgi:hypothetical protein